MHRHSVVAERSGELAEILAELETGEHSRHHRTTREWLEAPATGPASPSSCGSRQRRRGQLGAMLVDPPAQANHVVERRRAP